jgi:hypothetical protein
VIHPLIESEGALALGIVLVTSTAFRVRRPTSRRQDSIDSAQASSSVDLRGSEDEDVGSVVRTTGNFGRVPTRHGLTSRYPMAAAETIDARSSGTPKRANDAKV